LWIASRGKKRATTKRIFNKILITFNNIKIKRCEDLHPEERAT
jgi:hypothetical protein